MKLIELCLSDGVGGLELYALRTAKQLIRLGHDCTAVVRENTMLSDRMPEGIPTVILRRWNRILPLVAARHLAGVIDRQAPDIVHMHWGPDINLAVLAKRRAKHKVKLVYTRQMMITRPKTDVYHRFLYRHIDLVLTISRQLRDKARQCLPIPEHAVRLLYYGVDLPFGLSADQRQSVRRELGGSDASVVAIGLIGRMENKKGQHLLVEAMRILRDKDLPVHATFIGPVMDKAYFVRLQAQVADLGLQDHVTFFGSHKNPIDIMPAFDIVVLATEMETFGLVLIEAMRSGVAVVGSDAGGVPEIIEDGVSGLLFETGNAVDLAAKLMRFCLDPDLRRRLAAAGKSRADELFSRDRHYRNLQQILLALANKAKSEAPQQRCEIKDGAPH